MTWWQRDTHGTIASSLVLALLLFSINDPAATEVVDLVSYGDALEISAKNSREELPRGAARCDFNGDRLADLVLGAPRANGPASQRVDAGEVYVFFGRRARWPGVRGAATADVTIFGQEAGDTLGQSVACADVNGDGFDDVVASAPLADSIENARYNAGQAHLILGSSGPPHQVDLATFTAPVIYGFFQQGGLGDLYRTAAGDLNGDGLADVVLGAPNGTHPLTNRLVGHVYVLFGRDPWPPAIDLGSVADVRIYGAQNFSGFASAVWIGDYNADALRELVVAAEGGNGPGGTRTSAGDAFLFNGKYIWPSSIDLAATIADGRFTGADAGDQLATARGVDFGDLDDDGKREIWLGAIGGDGKLNTLSVAGEARIHEPGPGRPGEVDMRMWTDWVVYANKSNDRLSGGVRRCDANGDGRDDLAVDADGGDGPTETRFSSGEIHVAFGPRPFPATGEIGAGEPDLTVFGASIDDGLALYAISDLNNDGIDELVAGRAVVTSDLPSSAVVISHVDGDGDGIRQLRDNCPLVANPTQVDTDGDDRGDACQLDWDGDGALDALDCAPTDPLGGTPPEVSGVHFAGGGHELLTWNVAPLADSYDLVRGSVATLPAHDYGACQNGRDPNLADTSFYDIGLPDDGAAFAYLVRARNVRCTVAGTYGAGSSGGERINTNPATCP